VQWNLVDVNPNMI